MTEIDLHSVLTRRKIDFDDGAQWATVPHKKLCERALFQKFSPVKDEHAHDLPFDFRIELRDGVVMVSDTLLALRLQGQWSVAIARNTQWVYHSHYRKRGYTKTLDPSMTVFVELEEDYLLLKLAGLFRTEKKTIVTSAKERAKKIERVKSWRYIDFNIGERRRLLVLLKKALSQGDYSARKVDEALLAKID